MAIADGKYRLLENILQDLFAFHVRALLNEPAYTLFTPFLNKIFEQSMRREVYNKNNLHVVEYSPMCRFVPGSVALEVGNESGLSEKKGYYLSFPYMQFASYRKLLFVSLSNNPIEKISDPVYYCPLPNMFWNGVPCLTYGSIIGKNGSPPTLYDLIDNFWLTPFMFQHDSWAGREVSRELFRSYSNWQTMSKRDPSFITKVKWYNPQKTSMDKAYFLDVSKGLKICDIPNRWGADYKEFSNH